MGRKQKIAAVAPDIRSLPSDYPYGDRISESIADYAKRIGVNKQTVRSRVDAGHLPIIQSRRRAKREINLYALYLNARYKAERFVQAMQ